MKLTFLILLASLAASCSSHIPDTQYPFDECCFGTFYHDYNNLIPNMGNVTYIVNGSAVTVPF